MRLPILLALLIGTTLLAPGVAFAHYPHTEECPTTEQMGSIPECLQEQRQAGKEVKFVDMYFSEGVDVGGNTNAEVPSKIEVAPGDGTTILVAVMANSGAFELTGLKGWLSMPVGFKAAGKPTGEAAFDTYDLGIAPGAVFVFEFPVEVGSNTQVGTYNAILHVEYFKARDIGMDVRDFEVEFLLPGKSVLDARAVTPVLLPSSNNDARIEIVNDGSAPASGVIASVDVSKVGEISVVNIGKKVFNIGVIKPHSKAVINPALYVNPALADTRQNVIIDLSYFDAYGEKKTATIPVNFVVAGSTAESIDFEVITDKPVIHTITETPFTVTLRNTGKVAAGSVEVTVNTPLTATVALEQEVPEASRSPLSIVGGDGYRRIDKIAPGESADVQVKLFASEDAVNTSFQLPVTISYMDELGGMKSIQRQVSVYVQGTIGLRVYDFGITYIANEPNLSGFLLNEGTNKALFTTVELVDNQDMLKPTKGPQYLGDLTANSPLPFNIPVRFAEGIVPGAYPVTVKVLYSDDLRVPFEVEIDGTVQYTPPVTVKKESSIDLYYILGILAGVGIGGGTAGYYLVQRRKKSSLLAKRAGPGDDSDLDFLNQPK